MGGGIVRAYHDWPGQRRRRRPSQANGTRRLASVLLAGLLVLLAGCASPLSRIFPTPTHGASCAELRRCQTITPFCLSAVTPTPQPGSDVWYGSAYWPRNLAALAGFQPLLLSGQPQGDLEWNKVILVGPSAHSAQWLLHIGYQSWFDAFRVGGDAPNLRSLLAIEETAGTLDPLSRIGPLTIAEQYTTTVNGAPATVYHLADQGAQGAAPNSYQGIEVLWHVGAVTVRLLAASDGVQSGFRVEDPGAPQTALDIVLPGRFALGDVDGFWLGVAATVAPFTGCG